MVKSKMSREEFHGSAGLALIMFFRMLGLFLILPIFTLQAGVLDNSTPMLLGLAFGIYGLTQAILQIPFGMMSDRFGRKPLIITGLLLFMAGSIIAGSAHNIYTMIIGRAIQGAGAISAVVMALAADITRMEHRTKAMALIGVSIGVAFVLAFILGPLLAGYIGLSGIFYLTAVLAIIAILVLLALVPRTQIIQTPKQPAQWLDILGDKKLLSLDLGIFILHMVLMANFVVIPLILSENLGIESAQHWLIYLWVIFISTCFLVPLIISADNQKWSSKLFIMMIGLLLVIELLLVQWFHSYWLMLILLTLFFISFNFLEASLPSYTSKAVNPSNKGLALGIYSSSQFLGAFFGATMGGYLLGSVGYSGVFLFSGIGAAIWLLLTIYMYSDLKQIDLQT